MRRGTATVSYNSGNYNVAFSKGNETDSNTLTMTVTEDADPNIGVVTTAVDDAETANYTDTTQDASASEAAVAAHVKGIAETAVDDNTVTVAVNKITYTPPTAGTSAVPSGTDGSYEFTVTVSTGNQSRTTGQLSVTITATAFVGVTDVAAVTAAKDAVVDNGTVTVAFGASQADKTAAVQSYVNGLLTGVANAAGVTAIVSYNSGNYDVAFSKGNETDSKTLTMTVTESVDPNIPAVTDAKTAVENASYAPTQANSGDEAAAKRYVEGVAKAAAAGSGVTVAVNKIDYTAPIAGTSEDPDGTDGSVTFTVTVEKGGQRRTTAPRTLTITATAYTPPSSGGGGGGGGSTTTEKNPDGSTTTTVKNPVTGTVTETTKTPDGTKLVVETKKDGTTVATEEKPDGTKTVAETKSDGTKTETVDKPDGSKTQLVTTPEGDSTFTGEGADGTKVTAQLPKEGDTTARSHCRPAGSPPWWPSPPLTATWCSRPRQMAPRCPLPTPLWRMAWSTSGWTATRSCG